MQDLAREIELLKQRRKAVILAHNYQPDEIQAVADHVGDSFYLSKIAAGIAGDTIVFCGVRFMAETAKILAPAKRVLLPERDAGCPLAGTITAEELQRLKAAHPGAPAVCYVNSSAAVKAASDVCCTSGNAVKVVASLAARQVIFVPDGNLGNFVSRKLPDKDLVLWPGHCATHARIKPADVEAARAGYPQAEILVHPECDPAVAALADFVGSTAEIVDYAEKAAGRMFFIGTELGILHRLRAFRPDGRFLLLRPDLVCPDMKKTGLKSLYEALLHERYEVAVDDRLATGARAALDRMLELA